MGMGGLDIDEKMFDQPKSKKNNKSKKQEQ